MPPVLDYGRHGGPWETPGHSVDPCLLCEDLKWFRSCIDACFGKLLNDNSLQTIAEFQCGGLTLLKRRMKYDLFVLLLVGSPHGARTCFGPFVWYDWGDVMGTIFLYYCGHDGVSWVGRFSTIPKSESESESLWLPQRRQNAVVSGWPWLLQLRQLLILSDGEQSFF